MISQYDELEMEDLTLNLERRIQMNRNSLIKETMLNIVVARIQMKRRNLENKQHKMTLKKDAEKIMIGFYDDTVFNTVIVIERNKYFTLKNNYRIWKTRGSQIDFNAFDEKSLKIMKKVKKLMDQ